MKNNFIFLKAVGFALVLTSIFTWSCEKNGEPDKELDASKLSSICDSKTLNATEKGSSYTVSADDASPYVVSLLAHSSNGDGTYTWIWSVTNPNPGNGNDGTVQNLSHWGLSLGACAAITDIVSAATSTNGVNWTSFSPSYKEDKSQDCYTEAVLKFDAGTTGSQTTYYKLIVNKKFSVEKRDALYKSGNTTGCGTFKICAIGCPDTL